jgi:two-component system KDP operon response regulator KdpE
METILIVEDDPDLSAGLSRLFTREGFRALSTDQGKSALSLANTEHPDLILLDLGLPDISGTEVCTKLRDTGFTGQIVILTVRDQPGDTVSGLDLGADDYITKPFERQVLLARVRARLRRSREQAVLESGTIKLNLSNNSVYKNGREIKITSSEFKILRLLLEKQGTTVARELLLAAIWNEVEGAHTRTIDTHIGNLRKKLEADPKHPRMILADHGRGYRFVSCPD